MKRHRTDLLSMFSGLVFLGLGGVFVSGRVDVTDLGAQWLWPIPLILAGLFIFFAAFRSEPEPAARVPVVDEAAEPIDEDAERPDDTDSEEGRSGEAKPLVGE